MKVPNERFREKFATPCTPYILYLFDSIRLPFEQRVACQSLYRPEAGNPRADALTCSVAQLLTVPSVKK